MAQATSEQEEGSLAQRLGPFKRTSARSIVNDLRSYDGLDRRQFRVVLCATVNVSYATDSEPVERCSALLRRASCPLFESKPVLVDHGFN